MTLQKVHCSTDLDWSCSSPKLKVWEDGRLIKLSFARSPAREWNDEQFFNSESRGVRGECKGFSRGSRRRMLDKLNTVSKGASLPAFVTFTLPDSEFDDSVTAFTKKAKVYLDTWLKRLRRVSPGACGFWRVEYQSRKSGQYVGKLFPHFHLMVWGLENSQRWGLVNDTPQLVNVAVVNFQDNQVQMDFMSHLLLAADAVQGDAGTASAWATAKVQGLPDDSKKIVWMTSLHDGDGSVRHVAGCSSPALHRHVTKKLTEVGDGRNDQKQMAFSDWASLAWYHVVGSHDIAHFSAGVRVENVRSWGGVMHYCSKYIAKLADSDFLTDVPVGRQWGIFNRAAMPWAKMITLELPDDVGVRLRRVARRYLERCTGKRRIFSYGVTLYCNPMAFAKLWASPPDDPF